MWVFRDRASSLLWGTMLGDLCHPLIWFSQSTKLPCLSCRVSPGCVDPGLLGSRTPLGTVSTLSFLWQDTPLSEALLCTHLSWRTPGHHCSVRTLWGRWLKRSPDTVPKMCLESGGMVELLGFNEMLALVMCSQGINPQNARFGKDYRNLWLWLFLCVEDCIHQLRNS